ncbi:unnamed protein product [Lupinus luteus]|uniref:Uncharacterized protein n=1 Tax=Lupinus luteus TaxID=3873 RepID=A0AAV1WJQ1_LUPLU
MVFKAPRFMTILAYFWPMFASTVVFLVALIIAFFGGVSKFYIGADHGEKAGEGLLDYVAGRPKQKRLKK